MLNPFAPNYNYIKGIPILTLDADELLELKIEVVRRLTEETRWSEQRASSLVQIMSVTNIEIPAIVYHKIGLDFDSCNILSRCVLEEVYFIYLGHRMDKLTPLKLPSNRLLSALSSPMLNMICGTLSNPLTDIAEHLLDDNSADQSTLIDILLAAYKDYALEQLPRARLFPKYANKTVEKQILEILSKAT